MSVDAQHDHHGVVIRVPVHREGFRRWIGFVGAGLLLLLSGQEPWVIGVGQTILMVAALVTPDRREAHLRLTHDHLVVRAPRMGHVRERRFTWDVVDIDDGAVGGLHLTLAGEKVAFAWAGSREDREAVRQALYEAKAAYQPGADVLPDEPAALKRLRAVEPQA